jgi:hypothetical protein
VRRRTHPAPLAGPTPAGGSIAPWLESALLAAGVAGIAGFTAWTGDALQVRGGNYGTEYAPAMNALLAGRLSAFFAKLPPDGAGGSVLLRAPFAALAKLCGGDQLSIYRTGALACLLALGALAVWVARELRRRGNPTATRLGFVALCAAAPALLEAVSLGHPEEPLGACLCVAAVLTAGSRRPRLAGVLLGAAVINKPWGVLALAPVLLCVPAGERRRAILPAGAIVCCWLAIGLLLAPTRLLQTLRGAGTAVVATPQDLWWPLAHMDGLYPVPPTLLSMHARQLALALGLLAALLLAARAVRSHTQIDTRRCLALLALGFALRCLLEPSSLDYYQVPFLVALALWELHARRSVAVALAATFLLTLDFGRLNESATATLSYLLYLAVVLPLCAMLLVEVFARPLPDAGGERPWAMPWPPGLRRRSRSPSSVGSVR